MESKARDVLTAFEMVMEEIEDEVLAINKQGAAAFTAGDHELARKVLERADRLTELRHKIAALRNEWEHLLPAASPRESVTDGAPAKVTQNVRLPAGVRTPESEFFKPILKALVELGGSARMEAVLDRVEKAMRADLKAVDYEPLKSSSELRWRNTAQWARNTMVRQGRMKDKSPRGFWEISDAGRNVLNGKG